MIAYKTYADCPEEQRPAGIPLTCPWVSQYVVAEDVSTYIETGYTIRVEDEYEQYRLRQVPVQEQVERSIDAAILFGAALIRKFAAQNVLLGITQAGMTGTVLQVLAPTLSALVSGSLYEAINRARDVPTENYDPTFITAARVLQVINQIEEYLGIAKSESI